MNNFLVLGLPRSRTAWLANFLTYGDITCTHEGLNGCETLEDYRKKFTNNTGDANTGLALFKFERHFRDFKIIIIDRSIDESVKFGRDTFGADTRTQMKKMRDRLKRIQGLHIHFDDINSRLKEIWNYVSNDPFDKTRAEMLIGFDVQVMDVFSSDIKSMQAMFKNEKSSEARLNS